MPSASTAKSTPPKGTASKSPVVASNELKRTKVWGETDQAVSWAGAFAVYGGHGTTASSTIVYEIEPGKRLGWHTDATEETQLGPAACSCCRRRCGTTWKIPARRPCAQSPSSPPRCSPKTSTR